MEKEYDWFYAQAGTVLSGLWVAIEDVSGMHGPRVLDSDESLVALVQRMDRRLHQGVLIGRVPAGSEDERLTASVARNDVKLELKLDDEHTRDVWQAVERAKAQVAGWPAWKRGEGTGEV